MRRKFRCTIKENVIGNMPPTVILCSQNIDAS